MPFFAPPTPDQVLRAREAHTRGDLVLQVAVDLTPAPTGRKKWDAVKDPDWILNQIAAAGWLPVSGQAFREGEGWFGLYLWRRAEPTVG